MNALLAASLFCILGRQAAWADSPISFEHHSDHLSIAIRGQPFADYVFNDPEIKRPFLARVHAPGSQLVTRNHPPLADKDSTDHATMHPGIWLAFGELSGADFWRNKGTVEHLEWIERPVVGDSGGQFAVRNRYRDKDRILCEETCRIGIEILDAGYLIDWDSTFTNDAEMVFGDQEEMGLGLRMATPITVKNGGEIINSAGQRGEKQVWGQPADWCDYRGTLAGEPCGLLLMPSPQNFRPAWFHARDYGLLVANPFGQQAFTGQSKSRVVVPPGEEFRLRFGVLVHSREIDPAKVYRARVENR
ncbi:MAG: PmoA family protein [Pirellulales bacterium]